ncbi:SpoIIE family protein phosphatase [Streptomyces sp. NPDC052687]|uniref:SpoIIE family protein phosphatase n=1 Tax=Streptomyces sp. NPDC052687 TaxID=3154759 RepID=UPI00341666A8
MTRSGEARSGTRARLTALLTGAAVEATGAAEARAAGVYVRSARGSELRLASLVGLPGVLFRPWWRVHVDRRFPVSDTYRLGVQVVLANTTETMRRYPQFAAALPFPIGSVCVPLTGAAETFGVLTALLPSAPDAAELLPARDRLAELAEEVGAAVRPLEADGETLTWDEEPVCVSPPTTRPATVRIGRFCWDPAADVVTGDDTLRALLGLTPADLPGSARALVRTLARADAGRLLRLLRGAAGGDPPQPLYVRTVDGVPLRVELWTPSRVEGIVVDAGSVADAAADQLPQGLFCLDRLGRIVHANPQAARLLGEPRARFLGRPLWEGVPWLGQPAFEDHLRAALLAPDPVHFHVRRPPSGHRASGAEPSPQGDPSPPDARFPQGDPSSPDARFPQGVPSSPDLPIQPGDPFQPGGGDWLSVSVHPGAEVLACTVTRSTGGSDAAASQATGTPDQASGHAAPAAGSAARAPNRPAPTAEAAQAPPRAAPRAAAPPTPPSPPSPAAPVPDVPDPGAAAASPAFRPIVLALALTEAVTARQVSAVVMQELLPAFGGRRLAIYLLQDRHLYLAWETGFPTGFLAPFQGVGLDARLPGVETLTTGRPLFFDSMEQLAAAYPGIPLDAQVGARAFLPLIASGRPVGSCILGFDRVRSFSTEERTVLTALAGVIAHAMEKAQRYETEAALARGLQRALLPRRLPAHPRVEAAGRYLPGTQGMDVGGDWYDVIGSGDGVALVIGDVQGHGVQAAATMGQLRSAVRAFALDDRPPDEVLSGTNRLLIDLDPGQFASCCYVRLDPLTGVARIVRAGHPPPLLRHPDGRTRVLDLPGGVVLGVDAYADYPVSELVMAPGALLALYTDGLVERPGGDIDDGITALRLALAKAGAPPARPGGRWLAGVADRLTAAARHAVDRPDDIALLLACRRDGTGGQAGKDRVHRRTGAEGRAAEPGGRDRLDAGAAEKRTAGPEERPSSGEDRSSGGPDSTAGAEAATPAGGRADSPGPPHRVTPLASWGRGG